MMNLTTKLLLLLIVVLSGVALYFYFFRKKTATTDVSGLTASATMQASQLNALNAQVSEKISRTELANILGVTQLPGVTTSPVSGTDPLIDVVERDFVKDFTDKLTN